VLGTVFFVWVSVFNLFVVSVFWSFMADIWRNDQARRLFPLIALGGTAGAIVGPALTGALVGVIGVAPLLVVSAVLLGIALLGVGWLGRHAHADGEADPDAARGAAIAGGMFDGLRQVVAQPFVRNMALLTVLGDCLGTINYVLVTDYSGATFHDAVARTRFAADVDLCTNVLQVAAQLTLTRWLLVRRGAGAVIACWAMATVAVLLAVVLAADPHAAVFGSAPVASAGPNDGWVLARWHELGVFVRTLPWVALALIVSRGLGYGMVTPARESLFTRVPREQRYLGKNAVDTAVWRGGDLVTASAINALRMLGATTAGLAVLGATAAAASGAIGWRLGRRVESGEGAGRNERDQAHAGW
jgi:AAA family ATP:ADP antiporter